VSGTSKLPKKDICDDLSVFCPDVKKFGNPENCTTYFLCNDTSLYLRSCNPGETFHQAPSKCKKGQQQCVECEDGLEYDYKGHIVGLSTTPKPVTTTKATTTTARLVQSSTSMSSSTSEVTTAETSTTAVSGSDNSTTDVCLDKQIYCPNVKNLSDPRDCNNYFECFERKLYERSCSTGEKFHQNVFKCRSGEPSCFNCTKPPVINFTDFIVYPTTAAPEPVITTEVTTTTAPLVQSSTSMSSSTSERTSTETTTTSRSTTLHQTSTTSVSPSWTSSTSTAHVTTQSEGITAGSTTSEPPPASSPPSSSPAVSMTTTAATTAVTTHPVTNASDVSQRLTSTSTTVTFTSKVTTAVDTETTTSGAKGTTAVTVTDPRQTTTGESSHLQSSHLNCSLDSSRK